MASPDPETRPSSDDGGFGRVSHGYAPDGSAADTPPPVPLSDIVRDVVEDLQATAKAELALLEARGAVAGHGVKWASIWGFVAACALLVAMLSIAFGAILALVPHVGALLATLIVFAALILLAAFAGWQAKRGADDIRAAFRSDLMPEEEE